MAKLAAFLAIAILAGSAARAAVSPTPGTEDPRIQTVIFNPDQVVRLTGYLGNQLMVEFGPDEHIENVAVGDAALWQVTPNRRATLLFLKPLQAGAATNMTVVTDLRSYAFELVTGSGGQQGGDLAYIVRLRFPEADKPKPAAAVAAQRRNSNYASKGAAGLLPDEVFDDGRFTYFRWSQGRPVPAIFVVASDGAESLPNYGARDGYVVVEELASRFLLRSGQEVARVTRAGGGGGGR